MRRLGLALVLLLLAAPAAHADRDFQKRYGESIHGDIRLAGNKLVDCPDSNASCAGARAGTTTLFNNDIQMVRVDIDGDATTFNSSSAGLSLPAGADVRFAGLYWGGPMASLHLESLWDPPIDASARDKVRIDPPGTAGYQTITASTLDDPLPGGTDDYGAFADVTSLVKGAGSGTYTVADVQTSTGRDAYGGWALVVAFAYDGEPLRNLTVFDGWKSSFQNSFTQTVSGFRTPKDGDVRTRMGAVSYEGEAFGATGNTMTVDGTAIGDALNPTTDAFNGTITSLGAHVTDKTPNHVYQIGGIEIDLIGTVNVLGNDVNEAEVGFASGNLDGIFPQVLTFATEVQQPHVELTQAVTDLNGGEIRAGDVLEYTVTATNTGNDVAKDVAVSDTPSDHTTFVPGSIAVAGTAVTDASDQDAGEIDGGIITGRLGDVAIDAAETLRFRARIGASVPVGTAIDNAAFADYAIPESTITLQAAAPPAQRTVAAPPPLPALQLTKTVTDVDGGSVFGGDVLEYTILVRNTGDDAADQVTVTDPLPTGTTLSAGSNGADLGTIASGAAKVHTFRVTVTAAPGTAIDNVADADYVAPVNGAPLKAQSNTASVTVVARPVTPTPNPTPSPTPIATPAPVPSFASVVTLPSARRCVSRRRFRIRLRTPKGETITDARVFVNGKRVRVVRGSRLRAPVDLRGLPKGRFTVKIEVRTKSGRTIRGTRRYRTCTPKRRR